MPESAVDRIIPDCLAGVAKWFLGSGIQSPAGGVARFHHVGAGNAPVSTEITGYAVGALLFLHEQTGDRELYRRASDAVEFLTRQAWNTQLETIPFEYEAGQDNSRGLAYFFDCGIICRGLLGWWRRTGDEAALARAVACGESMARDFRLAEGRPGEFAPVIALPAKKALPLEPRWSRSPGCYQLKSAMAWLELAEAVSDAKYSRWYEEALDAALASEGQFLPDPSGEERTMDRLHAYCYFLEGLLPRASQANVAPAIERGIGRVGKYLRAIEGRFARSDVYAQLLRVRLYAEALGMVPLDRPEAAREASAALSFQSNEPGACTGGGFWFGRKADQVLPYLNPVSVAFCAQALEMWRRRLAGQPVGDVLGLI